MHAYFLLSNLPATGIFEDGGLINYFYFGVKKGIFPPLIFMGIGALTDFGPLLSNPKTILLGAAAQFGIFATLIGSLFLGFTLPQAGAIGIIGGRTAPRRSTPPPSSPPSCWAPSPSRRTATWRSCPSSSRPS